MFICTPEQYALIEEALDNNDLYEREDHPEDNLFIFRDTRSGGVVAMKILKSPHADFINGTKVSSYYGAASILSLAIDLMMEKEGILQD